MESEAKKPRRSSANLHQVYKFVVQQYIAKHDKVKTFKNACHSFKYPQLNESTILSHFALFEMNRNALYKQLDECYFELIKQIDDVFRCFVSNLIERKMKQTKNDQLETFKYVSQEMKYEKVSDEKILTWFSRYQMSTNDKELSEEIGEDNFNIIKKIAYKHSEQHHLLFKFYPDYEDYTEVVQLNPRYGFKKFNNDLKIDHLQVIDYYHAQAGTLMIGDDPSMKIVPSERNYINPVDSSNLILFNAETFYMMKFNLSDGICQFIASHQPRNRFEYMLGRYKIVVNQEDKSNFVIVNDNFDSISLVFGDFSSGKFLLNHDLNIGMNDNFWCFKLNDKILSGLGVVQKRRPEVDAIIYWELEMSENGIVGPRKIFEFQLDESLQKEYLLPLQADSYVWKDNICYINLIDNSGSYNMYSFNVTTKKCSLLNVARGFQFDNLYLDKNLIGKNNIGLYCFTFQVNKLEHLVWFEIRRQVIKLKRTLYNKAIMKLPLNSDLQLFYVKP